MTPVWPVAADPHLPAVDRTRFENSIAPQAMRLIASHWGSRDSGGSHSRSHTGFIAGVGTSYLLKPGRARFDQNQMWPTAAPAAPALSALPTAAAVVVAAGSTAVAAVAEATSVASTGGGGFIGGRSREVGMFGFGGGLSMT